VYGGGGGRSPLSSAANGACCETGTGAGAGAGAEAQGFVWDLGLPEERAPFLENLSFQDPMIDGMASEDVGSTRSSWERSVNIRRLIASIYARVFALLAVVPVVRLLVCSSFLSLCVFPFHGGVHNL
jgi:hypothetical protein